jgi:hypothetical protein
MSRQEKLMLRRIVLMGIVTVLIAGAGAWGQAIKLTLAPHEKDRKLVVAEYVVAGDKLAPPFALKDEERGEVACQWEASGTGNVVRWLVREVGAGKAKSFTLEKGTAVPKNAMTLTEEAGLISIKSPEREITRYYFGKEFEKFKKPFYYPIMVQGVSLTRAHPMEVREGEARDHVHHTSVYFCHGEVNGKDYWSKVPITFKRFLKREAGPVYARILAENAWGEDITEIQDVTIVNVGQDVLMDWVITLRAEKIPVHLGKTKEGTFGVRVRTELTAPDPGKKEQAGRGKGMMVDSLGNEGEPAIRAKAAPWADNFGVAEGKTIGVAIMNHPTSWRYPGNWHVRNYGLFAANPFYEQGEHHLKPGEQVVIKYRLYAHGGDPKAAKVEEVFQGYAAGKVEAK